MTSTAVSRFVYVTYIRTTADRLWSALTEPAFMRTYWFGAHAESDWKPGSPWKLVFDDGDLADSGEIVEADPPKRLTIKWRNEWDEAIKSEGYSLCTMELEPTGDVVRLTVAHEIDVPDSKLIGAVGGGWPRILSNLKSLLETGATILAPSP